MADKFRKLVEELPAILAEDPDRDREQAGLPALLLNPPPLALAALTVEPRAIEWVVPGLIAMGELALVNAQAGGAKSSLSHAAHARRGRWAWRA